jgi:hypothetical protein
MKISDFTIRLTYSTIYYFDLQIKMSVSTQKTMIVTRNVPTQMVVLPAAVTKKALNWPLTRRHAVVSRVPLLIRVELYGNEVMVKLLRSRMAPIIN